MSDINNIKSKEIQEIKDFVEFIEDYGHIFHLETSLLDEPFNNIISNIEKIKGMVDDSYFM